MVTGAGHVDGDLGSADVRLRVLDVIEGGRGRGSGGVVAILRRVNRGVGICDLVGEEWPSPAGRGNSGALGGPAPVLGVCEVIFGSLERPEVELDPRGASFVQGNSLCRPPLDIDFFQVLRSGGFTGIDAAYFERCAQPLPHERTSSSLRP